MEHFGVALWFTPAAVPSPLRATSAKLDARGPLLGNFALSETPKLQNALSESLEVQIGLTEVLETPKHSVEVSDLSRTFSDTGEQTFSELSVEPKGSVGHPLVYTTHNDAMTCCSLNKLDI